MTSTSTLQYDSIMFQHSGVVGPWHKPISQEQRALLEEQIKINFAPAVGITSFHLPALTPLFTAGLQLENWKLARVYADFAEYPWIGTERREWIVTIERTPQAMTLVHGHAPLTICYRLRSLDEERCACRPEAKGTEWECIFCYRAKVEAEKAAKAAAASATPIDTAFPAAPAPLETAAPRKVTLSTSQRRKLRELAAMVGNERGTTVELYSHHAPSHNVIALYARVSYREDFGNGYGADRSHNQLVIYHKVPDVHDDAFFGAQEAFNAKAALAHAHFEVCKHDARQAREEAALEAEIQAAATSETLAADLASLDSLIETAKGLTEMLKQDKAKERVCKVCEGEGINPPMSGEHVDYVQGMYRHDHEDDFRPFEGYICDQHLMDREWYADAVTRFWD